MRLHRLVLALAVATPVAAHAQTTDPAELARRLMEEASRFDPNAARQTPFVLGLTADSAAVLAYVRANDPSVRELIQLADMLGRGGDIAGARVVADHARSAEDRDAVLAILPRHIAMRTTDDAVAFADSIATPVHRLEGLIAAATGASMRDGDARTPLDRARALAAIVALSEPGWQVAGDLRMLAQRERSATMDLIAAIRPVEARVALLREMIGQTSNPDARSAELLLVTSDSVDDAETRLIAKTSALIALRSDRAALAVDSLLHEATRSVVPSDGVLQILSRTASNLVMNGDDATFARLLGAIEGAAPPQVTFDVAEDAIFPYGRRMPGDPAQPAREAAAIVALNTGWRATGEFPPAQAALMRASLLARVAAMLPDTALRRLDAIPADRQDEVRAAIAKGLVELDFDRAQALAEDLPEALRFDWTIDTAYKLTSTGATDRALSLATGDDSTSSYVFGIVGGALAQQGARDTAAVLLRRGIVRLRYPDDGATGQTANVLGYQIVTGGVIALGAEEMADWARLHPPGRGRGQALVAVAQAIGRSRERASMTASPGSMSHSLPDDVSGALYDRLLDGWRALPVDERNLRASAVVPLLAMFAPERLPELLADPVIDGVDVNMLAGLDEEAVRRLLAGASDPVVRDRLHVMRAIRLGGNALARLEAADSIRDPALRLRVLMSGIAGGGPGFGWTGWPPGRDSRSVQVQFATDAAAALAELPEAQDSLVIGALRDAPLTPHAARILADAVEDPYTRGVVIASGLRDERDEALETRATVLADSLSAGASSALRATVAAVRGDADAARALLRSTVDAVTDADRSAAADIAASAIRVLYLQGQSDAAARAAASALAWIPTHDRARFFLSGAFHGFAPSGSPAPPAAEAAWAATADVPMPLRDTLRMMLLLPRVAGPDATTADRLDAIEDPALRDAVRGIGIMMAMGPDGAPVGPLIDALETPERRSAAQAVAVTLRLQRGDTTGAVRQIAAIPPGPHRAAAELAMARMRHDDGDPGAADAARTALAVYRMQAGLITNNVIDMQGGQLQMLTIANAVTVLGFEPVLAWADAHDTPGARMNAWTGLLMSLQLVRR